MATEFKKLSEVNVLEEVSDTASVLVEQNGEIYRAPKTQVGGAGGYMLITLTHNNSYVDNYVMHCDINYDEMYEALLAGSSVWIDLSEVSGSPYRVMVICFGLTSNGLQIDVMDNSGFLPYGVLFPNGSHNLPQQVLPE